MAGRYKLYDQTQPKPMQFMNKGLDVASQSTAKTLKKIPTVTLANKGIDYLKDVGSGMQEDAAKTQKFVRSVAGKALPSEDVLPSGHAFKSARESEFGTSKLKNLSNNMGTPAQAAALGKASLIDPERSRNKSYSQSGPRPLNTMEITSGPRKGMRVGLGNNNDIKSYDAKGNEVDSDAFLDQSKQINLAQMRTPTDGVDRSIAGYSIEQNGASDAEMAKFKAGGGGSRILAGGRSARTIQGARPVQADPREAELKSIAMNSKFPARRRTALRELELMEKSRQFDATSKEGSRQFGIQEGRLGSQQAITNRQAEDGLGIDRLKAAADADYKNYLKTKTDDKSALNANQWHSQNQSYQDAWQKRTAPDSTISQPTDFSDAEGTPLDFKLHQYRDNPRAVEMYGPPNAQQKATLEINANPTRWAEFISLTPQQQQQFLANYIKNQGN